MDENYTYSEGDYCTCLRCGATVSTETWWYDETSPVQIHDKWHERLDGQGRVVMVTQEHGEIVR